MPYLIGHSVAVIVVRVVAEPDLYDHKSVRGAVDLHMLTGEQIARDFGLFRDAIAKFPAFKDSKIVGPDSAHTKELYDRLVTYTIEIN